MRRGLIALLLVSALPAQEETSIPDLIRMLSGDNEEEAFLAAQELRVRGRESAPLLVEALSTKKDSAFVRAINILSATWRDSRPHVERGLKSTDASVRLGCALILARWARHEGKDLADDVKAPLVEGLAASRSAWALECLAEQGLEVEKALPVMRRLIQGTDEKMREVAFRAYRDYGSKASGDAAFLGGLALGSDVAVAREAVSALGRIGPEAVPHIVRALEKGNEDLAMSAVSALGNQGGAAREQIPILIQMHRRQKSAADLGALQALVDIDPADARVLAVLHEDIRAGGRKAEDVARCICGAKILSRENVVQRAARFQAELRMLLESDSRRARVAGAEALARQGVDVEKAWKVMLDVAVAYTDKEDFERSNAIRAIGEIGPAASGAVPRLLELAAAKPEARESVVDCVAEVGRAAMPALKQALRTDGGARLVALRSLEPFGPLVTDAQEEIAILAKDERMSEHVARLADLTAEFSPRATSQILIDALRHEKPEVRAAAAARYARAGGQGDRRYDDLLAELHKVARSDTVEKVRAHAAQSFWALTGDTGDLLPVLKQMLLSADAEVRLAVASGAQVVASRGFEVPLELRGGLLDLMLGDANEKVRTMAWQALEGAGFPADGADKVILALGAKEWMPRAFGALAAGRYPEAADRTVPLLASMLADGDNRVVEATLVALFNLGPRAKSTLPKLKAMREKTEDPGLEGMLGDVIRSIEGS